MCSASPCQICSTLARLPLSFSPHLCPPSLSLPLFYNIFQRACPVLLAACQFLTDMKNNKTTKAVSAKRITRVNRQYPSHSLSISFSFPPPSVNGCNVIHRRTPYCMSLALPVALHMPRIALARLSILFSLFPFSFILPILRPFA